MVSKVSRSIYYWPSIIGPFIALATLVLSISKAQACVCGFKAHSHKAEASALVLFAGKVSRIEGDARFPTKDTRVHFDVYQAWKGVTGAKVVLDYGLTNCAYIFKEGYEYLVYGYPPILGTKKTSKLYETTICSRTKTLRDAEYDVIHFKDQSALDSRLEFRFDQTAYLPIELILDIPGGSWSRSGPFKVKVTLVNKSKIPYWITENQESWLSGIRLYVSMPNGRIGEYWLNSVPEKYPVEPPNNVLLPGESLKVEVDLGAVSTVWGKGKPQVGESGTYYLKGFTNNGGFVPKGEGKVIQSIHSRPLKVELN